jgi:protein-S-isoprenylcysteine O-methyltransferase Ste14
MTAAEPFDARWAERFSRVAVSTLFVVLAWKVFVDFVETNRTTDLLLLIGQLLVVVLTCLRRPASVIDRRAGVRFVATVSMMAPMLSRPSQMPSLISEATAALFVSIGLVVVVIGTISLGDSFGVLPANRGVKQRGLYRVVRHPIYLGYLITHIPFIAAHPSSWNLAVLMVGDAALIVRALYEEQTLGRDPQYVRYCQTVKWRIVPGIC